MRQTCENLKNIVSAAGLFMDHLVYANIYLTDTTDLDAARLLAPSSFATVDPRWLS